LSKDETILNKSMGILSVLFVCGIALASFLGYFAGSSNQSTETVALTKTVYQTITRTAQVLMTSTIPSCVRIGEGWAFYIHVVSDDTKKPVSGAKINALTYTHCGDILDNTNKSSLIETGTLYSLVTPDNGTVQLPTATVDGYFFTVFSSGLSYPFETFLPPGGLITNATLSVPSGNLSIAYYYPPH